jgi:hypothetical protein
MDAIACHEVFVGPSVEIVAVLVRHRMSFSTALVPQLQLWHLIRLVFVQSLGYLYSQVLQVLHFMSHGQPTEIVKNPYCLYDADQNIM